ncbi:MAG: hypothetical protein ABIJ36_01575 [Patescibacteria group bacterium]|nr:glycosyltransferase family 2 protein [Patescibacteria group bacterium]
MTTDIHKTYIEIEKQHPLLFRFLEIVPGFITWATLLSPIWLGILAPRIMLFFLTFLSIYWIYRATIHAWGTLKGIKLYYAEIKINWLKKCKELKFSELPDTNELPKNFSALKHFILIPTVSERFEVLEPTFKALWESNYPKENFFIVVPIEEKGEKIVKTSLRKIKERYPFKNLLVYTHPANIPGEVTGVGSPNRTWGAKHAIPDLKKGGVEIKDFIFTTMDSDTVVHKEFFARLSYEYLVSDKRLNKFFSTAVFLFNNNLWKVPMQMRIEANSVTLGTLSSWVIEKATRETFSCYSSALQTLIDAHFWDVTTIDDSVFFWRAFFARDGDFEGRCYFIPVSNDAVQGESLVKSHISLYKQLVRWGWGSIVFPISMYGFIKGKNIPKTSKLLWTFSKIERHFIWRTIAFLITFGFALLTLVSKTIRHSSAVYRLPQIISLILSSALILIIPVTHFRLKLAPKIPEEWPWWKKVMAYLEGPLIMINLLTYSFIPFLEAETKMMFGKKFKKTYYTPKIR